MIKKAKKVRMYTYEAAEIPNVLLFCPGSPHRKRIFCVKEAKIRVKEI